MTGEETGKVQEETALLFKGLGREQAKLFNALLDRAPLKEIGRAFDDLASLTGMILQAILTRRRPMSSKGAQKELERILDLFNRAAVAGRKVLLAAVRYARE